ncbi:MAG: efflux RND transporter periplasmic adaptor subunit [Desulfobacterales bacterium]|nr:efflux RND transporter periplasmic adaptor subunit [Pseudomonadota bacterium]MCG2779173.1 efflux RND transporter periplasmic adaptor subunit [Desulfobacterales bacterium]
MDKSDSKTKVLRFLWGIFPWLMVGLILGLIVILGGRIIEEQGRLAEAKKAAMKKEVPAVRVITLTLKPERLEDKISLPAEIEPFEDLWVKAEVGGQVVSIPVKEGQGVKKGQLLVKLDDRDYRSRLARIEANYRLARQDYERMAVLVKENIAAESKLEEIEARLEDLRAQRSEAQLALDRTAITAPISGRLNEIKAKQGDLLDVNQQVAKILQSQKVKVTVGVPESDVSAVFDLNEAEVIIEALGNRKVKGRKIFLSRQPRTMSRLYDLELMVPNPDGRILPGMFARVELVKRVFDNALAVPLYAVITQGDERFVYVEKDGQAEKRSIKLGVLVGWQVHVEAGLNPGERVIVVGHRFLDDGQAVKVIKNVSHPSEILAS